MLKEVCSVVEDEVDTSQLLECLKTHSGQEPLKHATADAVHIPTSSHLSLILVIGLDLVQFLNQDRVVNWELSETAHRLGSLIVLTLLDQVTGGLRKNEHPNGQDESPEELDGDWDPVRPRIRAGVCTLVRTSSKKETDGDGQLVGTDDGTTNPFWGRLRLVQWNCRY